LGNQLDTLKRDYSETVSDYTRRLREKYDDNIRLHSNLDTLNSEKNLVECQKRVMENDLNAKINYENNRNNDLDNIINMKNTDIGNITNDRNRYQIDHSNELSKRVQEQDKNNQLTKNLENDQIHYRNLLNEYDLTRTTLNKTIDDLHVQLTDETNRRNIAYDTNVSLNEQIRRTKDDLDIQIQLKNNIIDSNTRERNELNERINNLTSEKVDLSNDNVRLGNDLTASKTNADVLNNRLDTYHRLGYPYYYSYPYYSYPYSYPRYPYS